MEEWRMRMIFLFPGQGSQYPGMLRDLPAHPQILATFKEASHELGFDCLALDSADSLSSTVSVQTAIFLCGVAAVRALAAEGVKPDLVAGHSVGAFAASVAAGSVSFGDALSLVRLRGERMAAAFPCEYGMAVVSGMRERRLQDLICQVNLAPTPASPTVYIANMNSPDQIVITGSLYGIERVLALACEDGGVQTRKLNVAVPSHCPLLQPVSELLAADLSSMAIYPPSIPCIGARHARVLRSPAAIREDLAEGVAHPVRWHEAMTLSYELGARRFVEMPPGRILTDLALASFPTVRALSFSHSGMDSIIYLDQKR
jgi:malonate decarboxylase epsilon subunit